MFDWGIHFILQGLEVVYNYVPFCRRHWKMEVGMFDRKPRDRSGRAGTFLMVCGFYFKLQEVGSSTQLISCFRSPTKSMASLLWFAFSNWGTGPLTKFMVFHFPFTDLQVAGGHAPPATFLGLYLNRQRNTFIGGKPSVLKDPAHLSPFCQAAWSIGL